MAPITDWSDAYENGGHIPDAAAILKRFAANAAAQRAGPGVKRDQRYGPGARHIYDLTLPEGTPKGLIVFLHGGYWKAFAHSDFAFTAKGPQALGWAVAAPSYTLAPEARLTDMVAETTAAVEVAAAEIAGPIVLTGHSAGGHLCARLVSADTCLSRGVRDRISHAVPISGLADLRPLMKTAMNDILSIDEAEALAQSPALSRPLAGVKVHAWVGAEERPEFLRQNALLANIWTGLGAETKLTEAPGQNHFTVIEALADPESPLCAAVTGW